MQKLDTNENKVSTVFGFAYLNMKLNFSDVNNFIVLAANQK